MTAVFTGIGAHWARRQGLMYGPALDIKTTPHRAAPPLMFMRITLVPADQERFMISNVSVPLWSKARLSRAGHPDPPTGRHHPYPLDERVRSLSPPPGCLSLEMFVDCGSRSTVTVRIQAASKADSRAKSLRKVRISKND